MLKSVQNTLPILHEHYSRLETKARVVLIALAALAALTIFVIVRSLRGRADRHADALHKEGIALYNQQKYTDAIAKFDLALQKGPRPLLKAQILADRAVARFDRGQNAEALADLEEALKSSSTDLSIQICQLAADIYLKQNEPQKAIDKCDLALGYKPSDSQKASILSRKGYSLFLLKKHLEACTELTAALDSKPTNPDVKAEIYSTRGKARMELDPRSLEALADFEEVIKCNPKNIDLVITAHQNRAIIYAKGNEHRKAIDEDTKALGFSQLTSNQRARLLHHLALSHFALKDYDSALPDLKRAIDCEPEDLHLLGEIYYLQGSIFGDQNNFRAAIESFTNALQHVVAKEELRANILFAKGRAHVKDNNQDAADIDWNAAYECKFDDPKLRVLLSWFTALGFAKKGEFKKVVTRCNEGLKCHLSAKAEAEFYALKGNAHQELNEFSSAIIAYTNALEWKEADDKFKAKVYYRRSKSHEAHGQNELAAEDFRKYEEYAPPSETAPNPPPSPSPSSSPSTLSWLVSLVSPKK